MTGTGMWRRFSGRLGSTHFGDDEGLRRVALRLAAQTVGLLLVMLIVLEIIVYLVTRHALLNSLEATLQQSAHIVPDELAHANNHGFGLGPGGGPGPPPGSHPFQEGHPSEVSTVFLNPHLKVLGSGFGPLGTAVVDRSAVLRSLKSGSEQCCSITTYNGTPYLVYTDVVRTPAGHIVAVAQSNISAHQYEDTLQTLQTILLLVALLGLLASGAISAVLVSRALQPIRAAIRRQRNFVADAAHELRTPLAIMRTVGEVGLNDASSDDQQATIEQMLAENAHLTRLVNDLSLLARADTRAIGIDRNPVDLSSLVADTASELHPLAEEQGVALDAEVQSDTWVTGDTLRLRQLLLILLDNALKHTPAGGAVHIVLSQGSGRARLQVADSGPGIDPTDLPHIFDRFYRSDAARTGEGSGLGLSIGKWIAEAHGGQITAANAAGHGAVFTVALPLTRAAVQWEPAPSIQRKA